MILSPRHAEDVGQITQQAYLRKCAHVSEQIPSAERWFVEAEVVLEMEAPPSTLHHSILYVHPAPCVRLQTAAVCSSCRGEAYRSTLSQ